MYLFRSAASAIEVPFVSLVMCAVGTITGTSGMRNAAPNPRARFIKVFALLELAALPYLAAGVMRRAGDAAALYWPAAAIILSYFTSVFNARVLPVEINRYLRALAQCHRAR